MKTIDPKKIQCKNSLHSRARIDEAVVAEYIEAMKRGAEFPPVLLYWNGTTDEYIMADGFHRFQAWQTINPSSYIPARVKLGTEETARWAAIGANKDHGLRRSNADKRRAVELALRHPKGANLSNRRIAKHVGVNEATVRNVRRELETTAEIPQSTVREGSDGRLINTSGIGDKAMKYVNHTCSECHLLRNGRCRFSGDPQEPNASACAEYRPIPADVAEVTRDLADVRILDNWGDTGQTSRHVNGHRKRGAISVPLYEDNPLLSGVEIRHIFGEDWLSELYVIIPSLLIKNTEKTA